MGNGESNPIRNMDKRTARREYKDDFCRVIAQFRQQYCRKELTATEIDWSEWVNGDIRVFVRKRPIFKRETDLGEFDVATCVDNQTITIHDARMHVDMKKQMLNNHEFHFNRVFGESSTNQAVYEASARPLVKIAAAGGNATCLM